MVRWSSRTNSLRVNPVSEHAGEEQGKFISAVRFEVTLDGTKEDKLTFGAIGVGDSAQNAREVAVHDWYMGFGAALFDAIAGVPTSLKLSGFSVYPGFMGVRGDIGKNWVDGSNEMHLKILSALTGVMPKSGTLVHTLDLKIVVLHDGTVEGECRLNGTPSDQVFSALKKLPWPSSESGYMFKQAYVVRL